MDKKTIVDQALVYCSYRRNKEISTEEFSKLLEILEKFYGTEQGVH